ncbi:MAG TPA: ABC transporter substrate binding protein [Dongiaceae bacterium]|nr:ABC transporter substrate binding protein [Dongiaceae bacterium]
MVSRRPPPRAAALVAALALALAAAPRSAQAETSGLHGRVIDARGRPLPGVDLTLRPTRGGSARAVTDALGEYRFVGQRPGITCALEAASDGYRAVIYEGIRLEGGRVRTFDVRLKRPGDRDVVFLLSRDPYPFDELLRSLLETLEAPVRTLDLDTLADPEEAVRQVRAERPNLILGTGLKTARIVRREIREIPAILTLLGDPRRYDLEAENLSYVAVNPTPEDLVARIRAFLPDAHRLGLLYDARASARVARDLAHAAKKAGLEVVLRPCYAVHGLDAALATLDGQIDVLAVPFDPVSMDPEAVDAVTRWALTHRVPLAAPAPDWVRRGALFSYGATSETIGRAVSSLAMQILGAPPSPGETGPRAPAAAFLAFNQTTALALGVDVPAGLTVDATY